VADHPHFWRIESANGPTSTGVCQVCQESKEFVNSLETPTDYRKRSKRQLKELVAIRKGSQDAERRWGWLREV